MEGGVADGRDGRLSAAPSAATIPAIRLVSAVRTVAFRTMVATVLPDPVCQPCRLPYGPESKRPHSGSTNLAKFASMGSIECMVVMNQVCILSEIDTLRAEINTLTAAIDPSGRAQKIASAAQIAEEAAARAGTAAEVSNASAPILAELKEISSRLTAIEAKQSAGGGCSIL